ncbi:MAG: DsrE family protein [Candidatus Nanopelagicales bacterium]
MKKLAVKIASSPTDLERCTQALTVAASALAAGAEVRLWLAGDAVQFALPGFAESLKLEYSMSLAELRDSILSLGQIYACTQCLARRSLDQDDLLDGVEIAGAAAFAEQILDEGTQALVY